MRFFLTLLVGIAIGIAAVWYFNHNKNNSQFATAGRKHYRFRARWGTATDTDDREGEVVAQTAARPDAAAIAAALPAFTGTIMQIGSPISKSTATSTLVIFQFIVNVAGDQSVSMIPSSGEITSLK